MDIFKRLFGQPSIAATQPNRAEARPAAPVSKPKAARKAPAPRAPKQFQQEIVGESFYQDALQKICGRRSETGENRVVDARIILDNKNKHDTNAVRIEIRGHIVGRLSYEAASAYRARLKREGRPHATLACQAMIKGGWKRKKDIGSYGVWLDITPL